ncbi:MAG: dicarboxylate/amino acid:cation symporter [Beijerinckiaceae bacterium]
MNVATMNGVGAMPLRQRVPMYKKLYIQVIIAVAIGVAIGALDPELGVKLKPWGDAFIKAIKVVVVPVIFTTIVVGIAKMGDLSKVARVGVKSLIYFEVVSTIALLAGMLVGNIWKIGSGINADPTHFDTKSVENYAKAAKDVNLTDFIINIIPNSFIDPFVRGDILPVLFIAVLLGIALSTAGAKGDPVIKVLDACSTALFGMVKIIMYFAPLAALCAMGFTVGKYGVKSLIDLGQLIGAVALVSVAFIGIVLGGALKLAGFSLWRVLSYFKDEILFVLAATSAETMMPRSMEKLEKLGCSQDVVGLVMPSGFSFNMDGTAIYMTMAVLFIAHAFNIDLSLEQQLAMLFVMLFTSKGAAGVTGGGFVALAATLPVVAVLPISGLALLLGADRFMAAIRAATNLTSNIIATLVISRWTDSVDMRVARMELAGETAELQAA